MPGGFAVNANLAVVLPLMCHEDEQTAIDRGLDGAHFFGYSLGHYYVFGTHRPGVTDIWDEFQEKRALFGFDREVARADRPAARRAAAWSAGSGRCGERSAPPRRLEALLTRLRAGGRRPGHLRAQAGRNRHEHICESLELFAKRVMPRFHEGEEQRERRKRERLAPAVAAALARREPPRKSEPGYEIRAAMKP